VLGAWFEESLHSICYDNKDESDVNPDISWGNDRAKAEGCCSAPTDVWMANKGEDRWALMWGTEKQNQGSPRRA